VSRLLAEQRQQRETNIAARTTLRATAATSATPTERRWATTPVADTIGLTLAACASTPAVAVWATTSAAHFFFDLYFWIEGCIHVHSSPISI